MGLKPVLSFLVPQSHHLQSVLVSGQGSVQLLRRVGRAWPVEPGQSCQASLTLIIVSGGNVASRLKLGGSHFATFAIQISGRLVYSCGRVGVCKALYPAPCGERHPGGFRVGGRGGEGRTYLGGPNYITV